jgi:hypothetical protein
MVYDSLLREVHTARVHASVTSRFKPRGEDRRRLIVTTYEKGVREAVAETGKEGSTGRQSSSASTRRSL